MISDTLEEKQQPVADAVLSATPGPEGEEEGGTATFSPPEDVREAILPYIAHLPQARISESVRLMLVKLARAEPLSERQMDRDVSHIEGAALLSVRWQRQVPPEYLRGLCRSQKNPRTGHVTRPRLRASKQLDARTFLYRVRSLMKVRLAANPHRRPRRESSAAPPKTEQGKATHAA